jgi:hypothetical protein
MEALNPIAAFSLGFICATVAWLAFTAFVAIIEKDHREEYHK